MFKELFELSLLLILRPKEAWGRLRTEEGDGHERFLSRFVYPFVGLVGLAGFAGVFVSRKEFDLQVALKSSILLVTSSLGGFFVASYLLCEAWERYGGRERDFRLCQRFVGYSSVVVFVVSIVLSLLPDFFFFRVCVLYSLYVVWEGMPVYMGVGERERLRWSLVTAGLVVFVPVVIEYVLKVLMPGLRV
jgi:hypothetical protein